MSSGITLKQGKPPKAFGENLANHYRSMGAPEGYAERRSRQWKEDPDIITYGAKKDSEEFGWIIYHPHRSTIEEILVKENWAEKGMEAAMVDALISRESLVSSEILKEDTEKYTWMVAYGFRPTRFFASRGFEFVKMDLSTTVFLRKVTGDSFIDSVTSATDPRAGHRDSGSRVNAETVGQDLESRSDYSFSCTFAPGMEGREYSFGW